MDLGIEGRGALVLGAGGGLGGAIASALAREGANVALADVDGAAAAKNAEAIVSTGGKAWAFEWDLADLSSFDMKFAEVEKALGHIDILVNNTGGPPPTPAAGQSIERWSDSFQSMVLSVIKLSDRALPAMRERRWGRIITSTSSGVVAPIPNLGISNALRASLVGWSKTLSREVGPDGITTNIVAPGRIATARITFLDEQKAAREGRQVEQVRAESVSSIPVARYGRPEEYGDAIAFLASERASYITGSVIRVDGGMIPTI